MKPLPNHKPWDSVSEERWQNYHLYQYNTPFRSTVLMLQWLESIGIMDPMKHLKILDLGCGAGGNIYYMAKKYPDSHFTGIDSNSQLISKGSELLKEYNTPNAQLQIGDFYKLDQNALGRFDGLTSFQTLSWLPEIKSPLMQMVNMNPTWIALSSLFFAGNINYTILVQEYSQKGESKVYEDINYNIYSLEMTKDILVSHGYTHFKAAEFQIDIDLPKPADNQRGTYTQKLYDGSRLQISGALLMPWYFVVASKLPLEKKTED